MTEPLIFPPQQHKSVSRTEIKVIGSNELQWIHFLYSSLCFETCIIGSDRMTLTLLVIFTQHCSPRATLGKYYESILHNLEWRVSADTTFLQNISTSPQPAPPQFPQTADFHSSSVDSFLLLLISAIAHSTYIFLSSTLLSFTCNSELFAVFYSYPLVEILPCN